MKGRRQKVDVVQNAAEAFAAPTNKQRPESVSFFPNGLWFQCTVVASSYVAWKFGLNGKFTIVKPRPNGRNNSQHCWQLLVLQMLDGVGSCAQTDGTAPNIVGSCWFCRCWTVLAVVCKRTQQCKNVQCIAGKTRLVTLVNLQNSASILFSVC